MQNLKYSGTYLHFSLIPEGNKLSPAIHQPELIFHAILKDNIERVTYK